MTGRDDDPRIEAAEHRRDHGRLDDEQRALRAYETYIYGEQS